MSKFVFHFIYHENEAQFPMLYLDDDTHALFFHGINAIETSNDDTIRIGTVIINYATDNHTNETVNVTLLNELKQHSQGTLLEDMWTNPATIRHAMPFLTGRATIDFDALFSHSFSTDHEGFCIERLPSQQHTQPSVEQQHLMQLYALMMLNEMPSH